MRGPPKIRAAIDADPPVASTQVSHGKLNSNLPSGIFDLRLKSRKRKTPTYPPHEQGPKKNFCAPKACPWNRQIVHNRVGVLARTRTKEYKRTLPCARPGYSRKAAADWARRPNFAALILSRDYKAFRIVPCLSVQTPKDSSCRRRLRARSTASVTPWPPPDATSWPSGSPPVWPPVFLCN